ncbi:MAG: HEAT repeat domain-containing protein [Candidatus Riflebacteria bacterium]|nr:HEAT repeat domain-containing protein [Candidatus Riflebacteria bacterium]
MELNLKRLLKDLANPDDDLRALSAMTLMKIDLPDRQSRDEVIGILMKATKDKNVAVRFFARKAIDKLRQANLQEEGLAPRPSPDKGLDSENFEERVAAVLQIARDGKAEFKDRLTAMLKTERHDFVKASLISGLKRFLTKDEAGLLSPFLTDPDSRVRSNTIEALEFLKAEDAIPALFTALQDPDNRIRAVAAKALQAFGEEKVFAELKKMLGSNEDWLKGSAIYALSHIQAGEAITLLIEAAKAAGSPPDTRIKACIALANYQDTTSYGFLKYTATTGEEPYKSTALRALKLFEEKFGGAPPTSTIVAAPAEESPKPDPKKPDKAPPAQDLAGTVSQYFRKGKEEAIGLSEKAAISFVVSDLQKEQAELQKEAGRVVFEMYQQGDLQISELLTIGHEILRMNYYIQKYTDEEGGAQPAKKEGFFAQLKGLFTKSEPKNPKALQAERFTQKREELFQKLGGAAFRRFANKEFTSSLIEGYFTSYQKLEEKLLKEKQRMP